MTQSAAVYNQDELVPPQWLDCNFFKHILTSCEQNDHIRIISYKITPATIKGDHFTCLMFRGRLEYEMDCEIKDRSIIIKIMPEVDGLRNDIIKECKIFETEIAMYTEVIPRLETMLRAIGDDTILSARCLYCSLTPKKIMIFEDLVTKGYSILRNRTFSLQEARCALSRLAKWHAASYKILKEEPNYFSHYCFGEKYINQWSEKQCFRDGINIFLELLDSEPTLQKYKAYFQKLSIDLIKKTLDSIQEYDLNRQTDGLYVLCHGDFHERNIMINFHPESGEFENLMFLDFQTAYVGPITYDIVYSFYLLIDSDLRPDKFDELLYEYHKAFVNTLKGMRFEGHIPKLVDLKKQMDTHKQWEIFIFSTFLPVWLKFREGLADVEMILTSKDYQRELYRNPAYIKELEKILQKFSHNGFMED